MSTRVFLDRLFETVSGGMVELRGLPSRRRAWTAPGDWTPFGRPISTWVSDEDNVYVGVATRQDASNGTTENLRQLPALFVDFDVPVSEVSRRLTDYPLPVSLLIDSGAGVHAYWCFREPLDVSTTAGVHQAAALLRRLSAHLGGDDRATDPARILRVPGTFNFKYDAPRPLSILHCNGASANPADFDDLLPAEVVRRNLMVVATVFEEGRRNDCLYNLARSLRARGLGPAAVTAAIETANQDQCVPPLPAEELHALLRHVWRQPHRADFSGVQPTVQIVHDAPAPVVDAVAADDRPAVLDRTVDVVTLASVQTESIRWLWEPWLPYRKGVVLAGDPGMGKSMIAVDFAARVTRGLPWPTGGTPTQGAVLFLCAEDGLADTVKPRLEAAGGDPAYALAIRSVVLTDRSRRLVNLSLDLDLLRQVFQTHRPRLIVIDPITAYLGKIDSYKDAEVRGMLTPLLEAIEQVEATLLWIAHLNKASQGKALYRSANSIAFVAAARLSLLVGPHPDEPTQGVLAQVKSNNAAKAQSLSYSVTSGAVVWGGPVRYTADDLTQPAPSGSEQAATVTAQELVVTLRAEAGDGILDVADAFDHAELVGVPRRTLQYAARQAGLVPYCKGRGSARRAYWLDVARVDVSTAKATIDAAGGPAP